jgi:hypothetical protein
MRIKSDSDSSYENLLEKSQLPSLRLRRLRSMAIEVFKIINKQTPVYLEQKEHEHPSSSHLLIKFLKLFKLIPSFGSSFHNFAAPYLSECKPYLVVLTLGMLSLVVT